MSTGSKEREGRQVSVHSEVATLTHSCDWCGNESAGNGVKKGCEVRRKEGYERGRV